MRRIALLVSAVALLALAPAAPAQAPSARGTWTGSFDPPNGPRNAVRYEITRLVRGERSGTSRYRSSLGVCRYRLTLRARERGGFTFRERRTAGPEDQCSDGDRVFVRRDGDRLRVTIRSREVGVTARFTLRRR